MGHVRESVHIEAPPETAWQLGRDPIRIPEWNTTAIEVKDVSGPLDQAGSRFTVVSKIAGRPLDVTWQVDKVDAPRHAETSATTPGGGHARQVIDYEPDGNGTRVTVDLEYELPMGWFGEMLNKLVAERMIARDVRHSSENFKALVEEEAGVVAAGR